MNTNAWIKGRTSEKSAYRLRNLWSLLPNILFLIPAPSDVGVPSVAPLFLDV
jgi:hypothetical protein